MLNIRRKTMDIGKKIKQLRLFNGLTLEELASRCELTKGFLSQLENDNNSPSISTLEDILEALGTSLGEFFNESEAEKIVYKKDDFFVDSKDDYTINWIVPNSQKHQMEPIMLELNPDCKSEMMEPYEGEEFGYVLQGTVKLFYGNEAHTIRSGETFYISGKIQHYLINTSKNIAKILWVSNPPSF